MVKRSSGVSIPQKESLTALKIQQRQHREREEHQQAQNDMTPMQRREIAAIQSNLASNLPKEDTEDGWEMDVSEVMSGQAVFDMSHAGGEFTEIIDLAEDMLQTSKRYVYLPAEISIYTTDLHPSYRTRDYRTRRDRTERRTQAFATQMPALKSAYMSWMVSVGDHGMGKEYIIPPNTLVEGVSSAFVVDIYGTSVTRVIRSLTNDNCDPTDKKYTDIYHLPSDECVAAAFVKQGIMPCSPYEATVAITIRTLEVYRLAQLGCPHLSIHSFAKTLCDLHMAPFKSHLSRQFSIALDLYIAIRNAVAHDVQVALARDTPDWRVKHLCPPCSYRLEGDATDLKFSMLYTIDGNDSLKRILRREPAPEEPPNATEPVLGASSESVDTRDVAYASYLMQQEVDRWSKDVLGTDIDTEDDNPCAERWRNMKTEVTARMWGIFEETGLFLSLCRHGFVLLLADMVRSGER